MAFLLNTLKKLTLLVFLFVTFYQWFTLRERLLNTVDSSIESVKGELRHRALFRLKEFNERDLEFKIQTTKAGVENGDDIVGMGDIVCDLYGDFNRLIFNFEHDEYRLYIKNGEYHFPRNKFLLHQIGTYEEPRAQEREIFLISNDGLTMDVHPVGYLARNKQILKVINYYGSPMHSSFCTEEQIKAVENKNKGH